MLNDFDALVVFRPNSAASHAGRAHGWLAAAAYARTQSGLHQYHERWLANCRADLKQAIQLRRADE